MSNPQDLKKAIMATLAEKGDYSTILKHLDKPKETDWLFLSTVATRLTYLFFGQLVVIALLLAL